MTVTFDDKTIRAWAMKRSESAPTWWSRMAASPGKEAFGKVLFRGKQGISEPLKEPNTERHARVAEFILGNPELRGILSVEINEEISRITDQIREGPTVLEPVSPAPEPARDTARPGKKAPPAKPAKPEPPREAPAGKAGKAAPPEKPGKAAKPGKAGKGAPEAPAKDEKPARTAAAKNEKPGKSAAAKDEKPGKADRGRRKS